MGTRPGVLIHPTAVVDESAIVGEDTSIWAHVQVGANAVIGPRCRIGHGAYIDRGVQLGAGVVVHNNACLYRPVRIEDDVFIGPHVVFVNDADPRSDLQRDLTGRVWTVHRGATVGASVTVMNDLDLAEHCLIGAGAVVTRPTVPFGVYLGVPARLIGYRCTCRERYPLDPGLPGRCRRCDRTY
jgi:UDP-3-O-[3-hydroxymyristoyl] glucosamine N-acyltransferase